MSAEKVPTGTQDETLWVKRFLLVGGFNETNGEVLEILSNMILRCVEQNGATRGKRKDDVIWEPLRDASIRAKLAYYIPKNYKRICAYVLGKYGYVMYPEYVGVKNFVEQMAIVYSVFVKEDKEK